MKTDVSLKALGEPFQNTVHVDAIRIGPCMLKIFLQSLAKGIRNLMESYEFPNSEHLRVISGCAAVQPLNNRRYITEDAGVHQSWNRRNTSKWIFNGFIS